MPAVKHDYDSVARHVVAEKGNAGWFLKTNSGEWNCEPKDTVGNRVCDKFGISPKMLPYVMGEIAARPYLLVNDPYRPEFLPGRKMNKFRAQLIIPTHGGNHPTYDMILRHIGRGIDEAVKKDEWCQQNGITTGYDFILLWCAIVIKLPRQHLPYALPPQPRARQRARALLHKGMGLLFSRGYVSGTLALNEKFNKLLAGAVLFYLDEEKVSAASGQKVKLWIDADYIEMRLMRTDPFMLDNFSHWIAAYNFTDGVYVEDGDERIIHGGGSHSVR